MNLGGADFVNCVNIILAEMSLLCPVGGALMLIDRLEVMLHTYNSV